MMTKSGLVVGGGSAGLLTSLIEKKALPHMPVTLVRSKEIGVIGVGESTTVAIPGILHGYLELDPGECFAPVHLGARFLQGRNGHSSDQLHRHI